MADKKKKDEKPAKPGQGKGGGRKVPRGPTQTSHACPATGSGKGHTHVCKWPDGHPGRKHACKFCPDMFE